MADTKRSAKNTASRVSTLTAFSRALDMYFNKTDEVSDADKDIPVSSTVIKLLIDLNITKWLEGFGFSNDDLVIFEGAAISVNGTSYQVQTTGYAAYQGEVYKINTGTATETGTRTINFALSSTEDGPFRTLDIQDGTSGTVIKSFAMTRRFNGHDQIRGCGIQVGSDFNIAEAPSYINIAALDHERIALFNNDADDLRTYQFDGAVWAQVGNDLNISGTTLRMVAIAPDRIAAVLSDGTPQLGTYDFDGSDWAQVGNLLSLSGDDDVMVAAITSDTVAVYDNSELKTYSFDGSDWSQVGNGLTISGTNDDSTMCRMRENRVAFYDQATTSLEVYDWDGSDWAQVGSARDISGDDGYTLNRGTSMTALSDNVILIAGRDGTSNKLLPYHFDGYQFRPWGMPTEISGTNSDAVAITALSDGMVAVIDTLDDDLRAYNIPKQGDNRSVNLFFLDL